jgi:hypothetical protein
MWDLRLVKILKKGKKRFVIKDVYFNSDGTIGGISDRNFSLESESLRGFQEKVELIQTHIFGRPVIIQDLDHNKVFTKVG